MNRFLQQGTTLVVALGLSFTAYAGKKIDSELQAKPGDFIEIEHMNGKARIIGWDKNLVQVKGELDDKAEDFIFQRTSDGIEIRVEMPRRGNYSKSGKGDDLQIYVPKDSQLQYSSVNARVHASDILRGANVETVNGRVSLENITGRIRVDSVNGNVETKNLQGDIMIETVNASIEDRGSKADEVSYDAVNGHIWSNVIAPEVMVETVNGRIELQLGEIQELEISTVNGRVDSAFELAQGGDVDVSSVGGRITLKMPKDISARFDVEAHAGGKIVNDLNEEPVQKPKYGPGRWLDFSNNGGAGQVDVSTVSGKVVLEVK